MKCLRDILISVRRHGPGRGRENRGSSQKCADQWATVNTRPERPKPTRRACFVARNLAGAWKNSGNRSGARFSKPKPRFPGPEASQNRAKLGRIAPSRGPTVSAPAGRSKPDQTPSPAERSALGCWKNSKTKPGTGFSGRSPPFPGPGAGRPGQNCEARDPHRGGVRELPRGRPRASPRRGKCPGVAGKLSNRAWGAVFGSETPVPGPETPPRSGRARSELLDPRPPPWGCP